MTIINLNQCPEYIPQLAEWHHDEWRHFNPGQTLEQRIDMMQWYLNDDFIPSTFVALDGEELLGSAAVVACDLDTHRELTPWLASVYVSTHHRGQGIGTHLVERIIHTTKENGYEYLYLYTDAQSEFYAKMNWRPELKEIVNSTTIDIMSYRLD